MIVVDKVTKYYGSHAAVRDLSFKIEDGECVGFLGLNGAGKSTTLRMLSCLLLPTSGRITIRGLDAEVEPHEIRKFIGFLPDHPPVYLEMTVAQYLRFAGQLRQMKSADLEKRLPEVVETCGLTRVAYDPIGTLSHGYRQRVGIAQAIVHNPALLILDEPIQGLDPVQIVEMREMIRGLRGKHTILLSMHNLAEIERTCDRIMMLHGGRVSGFGTEDELSRKYGGAGTIEATVRVPAGAGGYRGGATAEASVRQALASVHGISSLAFEADVDPVVRVKIEASGDVREEVSRALVNANLGLLGLQEMSTGLESMFVKLSREAPSLTPPLTGPEVQA